MRVGAPAGSALSAGSKRDTAKLTIKKELDVNFAVNVVFGMYSSIAPHGGPPGGGGGGVVSPIINCGSQIPRF
jgi:hypothetical protein